MNGERARGESFNFVLIVYPGANMNIMMAIYIVDLLFVVLDPFNETLANFLYLLVRNFKLEAEVEKANKSNKVSIILGTLKASS
jgi:hypothetical protein